MSKVKIQGNAGGTGIFTVAAPSTNTDRTITLPDVDATVMTTAGGTIAGRTTVKDDVNTDKSYPFAVQNQSQQPWFLRAETTSNKFALHLNGFGNTVEVDSAGRVTMPYQPAFRATGGASSTTVGNYIVFTTSEFDRTSSYNTTNGRFTAPVAGIYLFYTTALYNLGGSSPTWKLRWHKNSSADAVAGEYQSSFGVPGGYHTVFNSTMTISLATNDYVQLYVESSSIHISGNQTKFGGHLIG